MKTCVPEYKDCTIPQIIGYIEPNPRWSRVGLHRTRPTRPRFQGMSTESTTTTEERVVYDVRFSAVARGDRENRLSSTSRPKTRRTPAIPW